MARRLDGAGVVWAVFAGAAAAAYGASRPLTDVDILVPMAEGARVAALFPGAAVVRQEDGRVRGVKLPDVDLIAGLTMFEGDAAYTVDLDDEMAARRTLHEIAGRRDAGHPARGQYAAQSGLGARPGGGQARLGGR